MIKTKKRKVQLEGKSRKSELNLAPRFFCNLNIRRPLSISVNLDITIEYHQVQHTSFWESASKEYAD